MRMRSRAMALFTCIVLALALVPVQGIAFAAEGRTCPDGEHIWFPQPTAGKYATVKCSTCGETRTNVAVASESGIVTTSELARELQAAETQLRAIEAFSSLEIARAVELAGNLTIVIDSDLALDYIVQSAAASEAGARYSLTVRGDGGGSESHTLEAGDGGIRVQGDLAVLGGDVKAASDNATALYAGGDMALSGGHVTAAGCDFGIVARGSITAGGASIAAGAQTNLPYYAAMRSYGDIAVTGGTLQTSGGTIGMCATGDVVVSDGSVNVASGSATGPALFAGGSVRVIEPEQLVAPAGGVPVSARAAAGAEGALVSGTSIGTGAVPATIVKIAVPQSGGTGGGSNGSGSGSDNESGSGNESGNGNGPGSGNGNGSGSGSDQEGGSAGGSESGAGTGGNGAGGDGGATDGNGSGSNENGAGTGDNGTGTDENGSNESGGATGGSQNAGDDQATGDGTGATSGDGTAGASGTSGTSNSVTAPVPLAQALDEFVGVATGEDDFAGAVFRTMKLRVYKAQAKSLTIMWSKVKGATSYVVIGTKCGKKYKNKQIATVVGKRSYKQTGLKSGVYYRYAVLAVDASGNVIATSRVVHGATTGGKVTNVKKVKLGYTKKALAVGDTFKMKPKVVKGNAKLTLKQHVPVRFETSNSAIAGVTSKGKVRAKAPGTCYVYAYGQSGRYARVKVTVSG